MMLSDLVTDSLVDRADSNLNLYNIPLGAAIKKTDAISGFAFEASSKLSFCVTPHTLSNHLHIKFCPLYACAGFRPLVVLRNCATNQSIGCSVNVDDALGNNQTTNLWYRMLSTRTCLYYFVSDLLPKHHLPKSLRIGSVRNIQ